MPVELLVPISVFLLGVIVAIKLAGTGIDLIAENNKK
jgi:hypothetical protein